MTVQAAFDRHAVDLDQLGVLGVVQRARDRRGSLVGCQRQTGEPGIGRGLVAPPFFDRDAALLGDGQRVDERNGPLARREEDALRRRHDHRFERVIEELAKAP